MTRGEKALLPPTWGIFDNQNIEIEIMCKKHPRNYELPCMVYVSNDKFILAEVAYAPKRRPNTNHKSSTSQVKLTNLLKGVFMKSGRAET